MDAHEHHEEEQDDIPEFDKDAIKHDITTGARAYRELLQNAKLDWTHWAAVILGLRGLRTFAWAKAGTTRMTSQAYRDAMGSLLVQRQYAIYDQIDKQTRSACYALMDRLEDVNDWYATLDPNTQLQWKHPKTIVKHCPREYLKGGMKRHNQPSKAAKKKPPVTYESERLRQLLIKVIKRLAKYEPEALELLDQVILADPDDSIDDVFTEEAEATNA
jgi:hypothetical protein